MTSKLNKDLSELLEHKIITNDTAHQISAYYEAKNSNNSNPLLAIFGILGSALVGLGIILILAHNWDDFSRTLKTVFAFLPLLIGQFVSGYALLKKKSQAWKESSGTFLFFAIGASMALVSQVYNIPGDLSGFLLVWVALALPLIYVLNSKAVAMLAIGFSTYYACELGYNFSNGNTSPWLYVVLILGTIPFYINALRYAPKANTTRILNSLYAISLMVVLGAFIDSNWPLGFLMYAMLFGIFYNLGKTPVFNALKLRPNSFTLLGSIGMVILLIVLSFNAIWEEVHRKTIVLNSQEMMISVVLMISAVSLLVYSKMRSEKSEFNMFQYTFVMFLILFVLGSENAYLATVLTNITLFILGVTAVKIGADTFQFSKLNYGLIIIASTIVCRFFDTDMSFVLRGVLFVFVGLGFFLANYIMLKKTKHKKLKELK